jgi:hypothetical protein
VRKIVNAAVLEPITAAAVVVDPSFPEQPDHLDGLLEHL